MCQAYAPVSPCAFTDPLLSLLVPRLAFSPSLTLLTMLPSPRFQLLSTALLLVLNSGTALADSGTVPLTVHPQNARSTPCTKGKGLLKSACTSILDHKSYCNRYLSYCNSFAFSFGDTTDRDGFTAYCSRTSKLNSCRQFEKSPTTTTTSGQGHRRWYEPRSSFARRADDPAGNLDVDTSDQVWYAVQITLGGQSKSHRWSWMGQPSRRS